MSRSFYILFKLILIVISIRGRAYSVGTALNTEEAVVQMGYPLEKYKLHTQDKYTLGLERIPYSKHGNRTVGKPVMLMHGLFLSSFSFTFSNKSLSYVLSDAGYDVWLFNARGVGLSRSYSIYTSPGNAPRMDRMSWNFSYDEMGVNDFPAAVDFVLNKTGRAKLDVVGYSLGGTVSLIALSEKPGYNAKVNKLVLMAPVARMAAYGYPLIALSQNSYFIKYAMKDQSFFPLSQDPDATFRFLRWLCTYRIHYPMCSMYFNLAQGILGKHTRDTVINMMADFPQPMSKKCLLHMLQLLSSKKFRKFDYGLKGNMQYYNKKTPPEYNLLKVTAPTSIVHAKYDSFCAPKDINWLMDMLPNLQEVYNIDKMQFGHLSFVMHPNIEQLVNKRTLIILSRN